MFQRQLSKEGLQQVVNSNNSGSAEGDPGGGLSASAMSSDDLRDLFTLRTLTLSDTYDSMCADDDSDVDVDGPETGAARQEAICREQACPAAGCIPASGGKGCIAVGGLGPDRGEMHVCAAAGHCWEFCALACLMLTRTGVAET